MEAITTRKGKKTFMEVPATTKGENIKVSLHLTLKC